MNPDKNKYLNEINHYRYLCKKYYKGELYKNIFIGTIYCFITVFTFWGGVYVTHGLNLKWGGNEFLYIMMIYLISLSTLWNFHILKIIMNKNSELKLKMNDFALDKEIR